MHTTYRRGLVWVLVLVLVLLLLHVHDRLHLKSNKSAMSCGHPARS
jgi:hypothetical protein